MSLLFSMYLYYIFSIRTKFWKQNALLYLLQLVSNHHSVQNFNMTSLYKTGKFSKIKETIAIEMKYYDQTFPIIDKLFHIFCFNHDLK